MTESEFRAMFRDGDTIELAPNLTGEQDFTQWWIVSVDGMRVSDILPIREAWDYYQLTERVKRLPSLGSIIGWAFSEGAFQITQAVERAKNLQAHQMPGLRLDTDPPLDYAGTD